MTVARDPPSGVESAQSTETAIVAGGAALLLLAAGYAVATHGVDETLLTAKRALEDFTATVQALGPRGVVLYAAAYALLELLLLPATPLALTAGALYGVVPGTACSAAAGLTAATIAFLVGRYVARDRVLALAKGAPQFAALDRAIGRDGFRVTLLINLSPLCSLQNLLNYAVRAQCAH